MPYQRFVVYNKNKLIYKPPLSRQLRKLPDGTRGISFRGKVYSIFNNIIDISKKSFDISECPILNSKQNLDKDKVSDEDFLFNETHYNPIFYFNGLKNDLNSFLYSLEKKKIDYLNADISKNKNFDYEIKISEESKIEHNLDKKKLIELLFESIETFSSKSFQQEIIFILNQKIEPTLQKNKIQEILNQYPDLLTQDIIYDIFKQLKNDQKSNDLSIIKDKELILIKQELEQKKEEIRTFEELLENKADEEYKITRISEQAEYISELEQNLNYLHNENNNLKKDKEFFINTDSKKRFLNLISETFSAIFPRIRLVFKSEIIIFEKFKSVLALFKILQKINNKDGLRFKKIKTSKDWFEVDEHISTGDEKKGRVYFSPIKNNLVLVVVDYKHNNKDQVLKFEKIISSNFENII
jgi:hypothetical protein